MAYARLSDNGFKPIVICYYNGIYCFRRKRSRGNPCGCPIVCYPIVILGNHKGCPYEGWRYCRGVACNAPTELRPQKKQMNFVLAS
jgi:hypothetical protein